MIRQLRLSSGLVMLAYVTMHLLNHAVGLWSLEAMTTVQHWRLAVTRCCALTMREAAMSSIARVIFLVDCTDRMRRR